MKNSFAFDVFGRSLFGRAVVVVGAVMMAMLLRDPALAEDYLVGPQDKLRIEVVEWRATTASIFEWSPLSGVFTVSTSGNLSMPILGNIAVGGKTVEQIADEVSEKLQKSVGLQQRPSASVEVAEYRPFFVGGLVARPGKYDYFPGLTVLQALSMAGGYARTTDRDMMGLQQDVLSKRGSLQELESERIALLARSARLDAVLQGASEFSFPQELKEIADQPGGLHILEDEKKIFQQTRNAIEAEKQALERSKDFAAEQMDVLKSKATALQKQADLADQQLGAISTLVSKGLSATNRQFGAEQFVSELQNRQLDVSMALISTQQTVSQAEFRIDDVDAGYRLEARKQQVDVRDRLTAIEEKLRTVRAQIGTIELYAPQAAALAELDADEPLVTIIIRNKDGELTRLDVDELAEVLPGDVVQVEQASN